MDISFKKATKQDISVILKMMFEFSAIDNYSFNEKEKKKNLVNFISNPSLGVLYIICNKEKVLGYIILTYGYSFEYNGKDAFIDEFYIKEKFRQRGIGKLTLDFIEEKAKNLNINAIHLEVERHNKQANKLYIKKGFKDNNRALLSKRLKDAK